MLSLFYGEKSISSCLVFFAERSVGTLESRDFFFEWEMCAGTVSFKAELVVAIMKPFVFYFEL